MTAAVEYAPDHAAYFGLDELDLLATHAGVKFPFPLRVPSFGRLAGERNALLAAAGYALCARDLATEYGPVGVAGELVTALREHRSAVDLVVIGARTVTGVVAMVYRNRAVVCHQSLHDEQASVRVTRVSAVALADEFSALIPTAPPAAVLPITVPPGVVGGTLRLLSNTADTPATRRCVRGLVREGGGDDAAVDQLIDLLPELTGRGQLGAVRRVGSANSRPLEMSWLDSPRGRVRIDRDDNGWLSVNPLRRSDLVRVLREAVAIARA